MVLLLGFDLSIMANDLYDEAIIDIVAPEALLSKAYPIKVSLGFR
jgi:type I protein arginine methyltransferase